MEFSCYISVILIVIKFAPIKAAHGYQVCMLKRRPDPSRNGQLRWSLPYSELCFCQAVVAPNYVSACPANEDDYEDGELWFIDDPNLLTMRHNWNKNALDELLDRREYCANECALMTDTCDVNAVCTDVPGSFKCTCSAGFSGDGFTCEDTDECRLPVNICDDNAVCINTVSSFSCVCEAGYSGYGEMCSDDDECALLRNNCDENAICINTPGSFSCECNAGYNGEGETCIDSDECDLQRHNCDINAVCLNTPGSFSCVCNAGYSGDGEICTDVENPVISASDIETSVDGVCFVATNVSWMYTASDNSGEVTLTSDIPSGSEFSIGTTNVTLTAVDLSGNVAMASFMVLVTVISGTSIPLGLEDGSVADSQLTASSSWNANFAPKLGRLHNTAFWATTAGGNAGGWIQVDFLTPLVVTAIQTQGASSTGQWVKKYNLQFGTDVLKYYTSPTDVVEFIGNTDQTTVVENAINPILTRYVRILSVQYNYHVALRMEVIGYRCS